MSETVYTAGRDMAAGGAVVRKGGAVDVSRWPDSTIGLYLRRGWLLATRTDPELEAEEPEAEEG